MSKKTSVPEFNLSEVIRTELTANSKVTCKELAAIIAERYPKQKINKNSLSVGFYTARRKLGVSKVKRGSTRKNRATNGGNIDITALKAAVAFLKHFNSVETAIEMIKTVDGLQLN